MEASLNLGGQTLHRWNLRLMPNIYSQVVLRYLEWFWRNSLLKYVLQPKIAKKFTKNAYFGVQGRSRSSMLAPLESPSALLVMISSKSVSICNRFHGSGKITISKGDIPLWCPRSRGISSPSGTKITSLEIRVLAVAHSEDFIILSCVVLTQYSSVTDWRTEGRLCRSKDALSITCCRA